MLHWGGEVWKSNFLLEGFLMSSCGAFIPSDFSIDVPESWSEAIRDEPRCCTTKLLTGDQWKQIPAAWSREAKDFKEQHFARASGGRSGSSRILWSLNSRDPCSLESFNSCPLIEPSGNSTSTSLGLANCGILGPSLKTLFSFISPTSSKRQMLFWAVSTELSHPDHTKWWYYFTLLWLDLTWSIQFWAMKFKKVLDELKRVQRRAMKKVSDLEIMRKV